MSFDLFVKKFKQLEGEIFSKQIQETLGELAVQIIYNRVKSGKGVDNDNNSEPETTNLTSLKRLSNSYIQFRKGLVVFRTNAQGRVYPIYPARKVGKRGKPLKSRESFPVPVTGKYGSAAKSNLTLTGQMLDALTYTASRNKVRVFIKNTIRSEGKFAKKLTNQQVAEYVSKDRPFMAIASGEMRILIREYERYVATIIKKLF